MEKLYRCRFIVNGEDPRPVKWPIKHPYWITGYDDDDYAIIVSYTNDENYIYENWPDAKDIGMEEMLCYVFSDRFPSPKWFNESEQQ